jgi:hypothetical protein
MRRLRALAAAAQERAQARGEIPAAAPEGVVRQEAIPAAAPARPREEGGNVSELLANEIEELEQALRGEKKEE